jgi:hypothetical protein
LIFAKYKFPSKQYNYIPHSHLMMFHCILQMLRNKLNQIRFKSIKPVKRVGLVTSGVSLESAQT